MLKEKYVTYCQLNQFFEENSSLYTNEILIKEAQKFFAKENLYKIRDNLFPLHGWVLDLPENEFESYCDKIQINLDNLNPYHMEDINNSIILEGYKCFMYRHITNFPHIEHGHSFFEVCYVWKGSCKQFCNGIQYDMEMGDFLIIPPGISHYTEVELKDSIIFNLVIPKNLFHTTLFDVLMLNHSVAFFIRNCLFNKKTASCMFIRSAGGHDFVGERKILQIITYECYQIEAYHGMMVNASVCQLFGIIMSSNSLELSFSNVDNNDSVLAILDYLNNNYRTITLSFLSQFFGYNESYMSRLIKKVTGMTFSQLIRAIRVSHSVQMLECTEFPLQKISDIVGYSDIGSFARAFKQEKGMGPKDYRDRKKRMLQND